MSIAYNNARNQYLKTQVETASKEQLVVMLFDGIVRFTEQARKAMREKAIEECHNALMRAQAIVMELIVTVDKEKGGEVATNLIGLHAYAFNALVQCNMHKDESKIDEVQSIYRKLREGWVGAMENLGIVSAAAKPTSPQAAVQNPAPASAPAQAKPVSAPAAPKASSAEKPPQGPAAPGLMAAAKQPGAPAAPVAPAAAPKAAGVYGMGRTAMLGGFNRPAGNQYQAGGARSIA